MEIRNVSKYLAVAVLAGIWGCSPKQTAQRSYVYDDLYSASSDVRAVAYSNKQNNVVGDQAKEANSAGNEYYNKAEAEKYNGTVKNYSSSIYDNAYQGNTQQQYAYNNGYGNWNPYGWNSWNSWNNSYYPMYGFSPGWSIGLGIGSGFYRPWGLSSWYGGGFYDPWYSSWGYNPYYYNSWGYYPSYYGGGYYGGGYYRDPYYYGGGNVVVNPGNTNTGSSYSRPRSATSGRSQSAYNGDFVNRNSNLGSGQGGRTAYDNNSASNGSYYSRPRRDGGDYSSPSSSGNSYRSGNGTVNRDNNTYSRGWNNDNSSRNNSWSQPSNNSWNNSPSRSYSAPSSGGGGGGGGGGGARSRGPR